MARKNLNFNYIFVLIYMAFIFYLSSIPLNFPEVVDRIDPSHFLLHIAEYSLLGFLLFNANKNVKFSFFIGSVYGLSDEIYQTFVPFRQFSMFDLIADAIGISFGIALFLFSSVKKVKLKHK